MTEDSSMIKIGLIQMRCEKGAIAENLASLSHYIAEADARDIDIIGFPEMSVTGYADPTKYPEAIIRLNGVEIGAILEMTKDRKVTVLAGLIEENPKSKPFITQVVIRNGLCMGYYRKNTVKDDDNEWFSPGDTIPVFAHDDLSFGIAICSDTRNERVLRSTAGDTPNAGIRT